MGKRGEEKKYDDRHWKRPDTALAPPHIIRIKTGNGAAPGNEQSGTAKG